MIDSGKLDKRITFQSLGTTRDTMGGVVDSWSDFATVWAKVEPLSGRELLAHEQAQSEVNIKVTMRYYPGVLPEMRISYGSKYFSIKNIVDIDEKHRWLEVFCSEGVRDA